MIHVDGGRNHSASCLSSTGPPLRTTQTAVLRQQPARLLAGAAQGKGPDEP